MKHFPAEAHHETIGVALLALLATLFLCANLGNHHLWQDEAQTALISQTVLERGTPHGTDGRNFFSQELGVEYGDGYIWKWHTWLSFYLVAGSFALLGPTALAARLPFALFGIGTIVLSYYVGRTLWRDRRTAAAGALLLCLSVAFLVLCRQARWYSVASFFALLGLHAYARLEPGKREPAITLFASASLLFHTHYFYAATLLLAVLLHAALVSRRRLRAIVLVSAAVTVVNLPWILWFATMRFGDSYADRLATRSWLLTSGKFAELVWEFFFHPWLLLVPLGLALERLARRQGRPTISRETLEGVLLLLLFGLVTIGALSVVTPGGYFRYLTPLAPPAFLLCGLLAGGLFRRSALLGVAAIAAIAATSPLRDLVYELTHDYDGPVEGIVEYLDRHADPGDTVAITYGDLPLKFYTGLRVVGGLTGEDLAPAEGARWVIPRRFALSKEEKRVQAHLVQLVRRGGYQPILLDYPDTVFQNRETLRSHRFRTAPKEWPRVVIFRRKE